MTTTSKIIAATPSIEKLLSQDTSLGVAVKLSKIQKELTEILKLYDEKRISLLDEYGVKGETEYTFEDGQQELFSQKLSELLEEELELNVTSIPSSDLGDVKLSGLDVSNLDFIITE